MFEDLLDWVGDIYDKLWPFSQKPWDEQPDWVKRGMEAATLLLVILLLILLLLWLFGFFSSSEAPTSSQGSQSVPTSTDTGVVYLHVVVYDRPPCTTLPLLNLTVDPENNQPTAQGSLERPGDAYPGPCHWDLPFRAGTTLTWSLTGTSYHGWGIPYTWVGQTGGSSSGQFCRGSFALTETQYLPTDQETHCSIKLSYDSTFTVTDQTEEHGINNGVSYLVTRPYPQCLPASGSPTFKPEPEPCEGG